MIADVWSKRDYVAAAVAIVGFVVAGLGELLDLAPLATIGILVALGAMVVFTAGRVRGASDRRDGTGGEA